VPFGKGKKSPLYSELENYDFTLVVKIIGVQGLEKHGSKSVP